MTPGRTRCGQRFCGGPSPGSELAHSSGTPWPSSPGCQPLSKEPPQVSKQRAPSALVESRDVDPRGHLDPPPCGREGSVSRCGSTLTSRGDPRTQHSRSAYGHRSGSPSPAPPTSPGSNSLVTPSQGPPGQSEPRHAGGGGAGAGPSSSEM